MSCLMVIAAVTDGVQFAALGASLLLEWTTFVSLHWAIDATLKNALAILQWDACTTILDLRPL